MREINNIIKILLSRVILLLYFWEFTLIYSLNWGELTCIIYQDDYNQHGNEIILLFYLVFSGFCDIKKTIGIRNIVYECINSKSTVFSIQICMM